MPKNGTKRAILLLYICMLFLSLPVSMNAQETEEPATKEPPPQEESPGVTFYMPYYIPDPVSFFLSEYQNALANEEEANWYLTLFCKIDRKDDFISRDEYSGTRGAFSTGFILPIWGNDKGDSWSLIGHFTGLLDTIDARSRSSVYSSSSSMRIIDYFVGGGIRADYDFVSVGFLCGNYGGTIDSSIYDAYYSDNTYYSSHARSGSVPMDNLFRFSVPVSFGLSERIIFIDKLIANFAFDNFNLTQLLANLVFNTLNIGIVQLGVNVYYKDESYNMAATQRMIGASFTTKYLQFDGGYRFFIMKPFPYFKVPPFDDGAYGRIMLKLPFEEKGALACFVTLDNLYQADGFGVSLGIGISLFGSVWQTFGDFSLTTFGTHVNLRANE